MRSVQICADLPQNNPTLSNSCSSCRAPTQASCESLFSQPVYPGRFSAVKHWLPAPLGLCRLGWGQPELGTATPKCPQSSFWDQPRVPESPQLLELREPSQGSSWFCCSSKKGLKKEVAAPRGGTLEVTLSSALATDEKQDFGTDSPGMMLGAPQGAVLARGLGQRNKNHF